MLQELELHGMEADAVFPQGSLACGVTAHKPKFVHLYLHQWLGPYGWGLLPQLSAAAQPATATASRKTTCITGLVSRCGILTSLQLMSSPNVSKRQQVYLALCLHSLLLPHLSRMWDLMAGLPA
jgi:hypothetical protein